MFIMITHIQVYGIHHTIVTLRLLVTVCEKMFLNPACTEWMKTYRKKETHSHVRGCFPSEEINKKGHKCYLYNNIYNGPFIYQGNFFDFSRTDHLKKGIE